LRVALNRYEFDAVGLSELNVLWHRVDESERIPEWTFGWWRPFQQTTTYFRGWNSTSPLQFGGVSLWSMGHLATRWMQDDSDRRGLGRWTSTLYRGVGDVRLRYVAAYCPNSSVTGAETVWSQHKSFFMSKFMGIDPIDAFYADLCKDVKGWVASGEQVVLMLDLNDDIRTSRFTQEMGQLGLIQLLGKRHGNDNLPGSFIRGSRPLDGLYVSPLFQDCACGYLPFDIFDHRPVWIDIPFELAFGQVLPELDSMHPVRLNMTDPRCMAKYLKHFKKRAKEKNLFVRGKPFWRLEPCSFTTMEAQGWEALDRDRRECHNYAMKQCRKLRMGKNNSLLH
jgi:hypothetical protein